MAELFNNKYTLDAYAKKPQNCLPASNAVTISSGLSYCAHLENLVDVFASHTMFG